MTCRTSAVRPSTGARTGTRYADWPSGWSGRFLRTPSSGPRSPTGSFQWPSDAICVARTLRFARLFCCCGKKINLTVSIVDKHTYNISGSHVVVRGDFLIFVE